MKAELAAMIEGPAQHIDGSDADGHHIATGQIYIRFAAGDMPPPSPLLLTEDQLRGSTRTVAAVGNVRNRGQQGNHQAVTDTFARLLQECIKKNDIAKGKQVHTQIIQSGFEPSVFLLNTLVNMYAKCGCVVDAHQVFEKMPKRNLFTWTIMIAGYAKLGCSREALEIYEQMQRGGVTPDKVTFISVVNACASLGALEKGRKIHADIIKARIGSYINLENTLIDMYFKCGSIKDARQVFDYLVKRDVVSWSAMIAGYARHRCGEEAFKIYEQMQQEGVMPDRVTFICVLNVCASLKALEKGKEVHCDMIKAGITSYINLENTLVDMYAKCGSVRDARQVFDKMVQRDVVSWNAMIIGYAQHGYSREAFLIYKQMIQEAVIPNKVTFICILNAFASLGALKNGIEVHEEIRKAGIVPDIILETALVGMYAKCGSVQDARQVFDNMAKRNVVSWNAMIAGYAEHGRGREAFKIYEQMLQEGVMPDKVTFIGILNACASLAVLEKGKELHADISKSRIAPDIILQNTLVDMYANCGSIKDAHQVFDNMAERNVVSWNVMIAGYAQHGCGREALQLFERMQQEGLKPDEITFICLLSACSHVGLVDEGRHYFDCMSHDHGLTPMVEHFSCVVDLLGRGGRLDEAEDFINKMPMEPDASVWGALVGACRIHGNVELAERASKCLLQWDPL